MKRIFMLAGAVLLGNIVSAQNSINPALLYNRHNAILNSLLQQNHYSDAAMKTTSVTAERVIAQSTLNNTAHTLSDSVSVNYTLYRASAYDYNTMLYPYSYPYNTSPMFNNAAGVFTKPQVLFDTFMHWTIDPNTEAYGYYETAYANYDANNNITGYLDLFADSSVNPNVLYANKFNAAKNIDTAYWNIWQSGTADSAFKQFFTYNSANLITKDSTYELHLGAWRIASRSLYTYDGSNNLIQIDNYANTTDTSFLLPLVEQYKYVNTYDASHRLLTVYSSFYDGSALAPYIQDTFAYSGTYTYHNSWREYQYDPINLYWAPMFNMAKTINAIGLPDTINKQGFDSILNAWVPQTLYVASYNTFKDPDTLLEYDYNFTAYPATPSYITKYYYSTFVNKTEVNNVAVNNDAALIFPNPATNQFTITQLNVPLNTSVFVTLMNEQGQMVMRQNMHWQGQTQISINGLIPGAYWVAIQDDKGNMLHRQAIVKQ